MLVVKEYFLETSCQKQQKIKGILILMKEKKRNAKKALTDQTPEKTTLKEITPKKLKKKKYILLYVAIIGFVFYAVITIINQSVQIADKKAELQELQQQINVVEIQTQHLQQVQNYKGEELSEYMEKIAKDELGYVSEGERIFINVAGE